MSDCLRRESSWTYCRTQAKRPPESVLVCPAHTTPFPPGLCFNSLLEILIINLPCKHPS